MYRADLIKGLPKVTPQYSLPIILPGGNFTLILCPALGFEANIKNPSPISPGGILSVAQEMSIVNDICNLHMALNDRQFPFLPAGNMTKIVV